MVRNYLSPAELVRGDIWLDAIEAGLSTTLRIAAETGLTQRRIRQRVAQARGRREADGPRDAGERLDRFDYPFMELVESHAGSFHEWCELDSPGDAEAEASAERGTFHVGGQVRSLRGGMITTDDSTRTDGTAQPTSYQPDPQLKGGVG